MPKPIAVHLFLACAVASTASAATNQFRGVNWADPGDNFQSGVIYLSGLSSSDTYSSASTVADRVVGQVVSELGANSVRLPINEATVSQYWSTYTGAIDTALTKGNVILCYWSASGGAKPADMTKFWSMWTTVVAAYGSNSNAYFEVYNEPAGYSTTDLGSLYQSWLTEFASVPRSRVILDGTGYAQNIPPIGSDSRFDGCLLAVHQYSMFGNTAWTSESQWVSQFTGYVGTYSDRTVCTEWGGPMSAGSKNGVSYGPQDYDSPPGSYFVAYIRGTSSQLRAWSMGSFFWAGLKDGDWYSMTTKSGSGASISLSVSNQSGLDRLQYAWGIGGGAGTGGTGGGTGTGGAGTGAGGTGGRGGAAGGSAGASGSGGAIAGSSGGAGTSGAGGRANGGQGGAAGGSGTNGAGSGGRAGAAGQSVGSGGADGTAGVGGASGGTAGTAGSGGAGLAAGGATGATQGAGGVAGSGGVSSGGASQAGSGSGGTVAPIAGGGETGCSCAIQQAPSGGVAAILYAFVLIAASRRRPAARDNRRASQPTIRRPIAESRRSRIKSSSTLARRWR